MTSVSLKVVLTLGGILLNGIQEERDIFLVSEVTFTVRVDNIMRSVVQIVDVVRRKLIFQILKNIRRKLT